MKVKLKICGMKYPDNIREVAALQPDYMGFIFYPSSPRFVGRDFAIAASNIENVAVSVNQGVEDVTRQAKQIGAKFVQLHGQESVEDCTRLRSNGFKVIKVFSVGGGFDFNETDGYERAVDYFLFDTKGKLPGGNAVSFDWHILRNYHQRVPFFLSGGLNEENLAGVKELMAMNLHALDLNSGVETSPGLKDIEKVLRVKELIEGL